MSRSLIQTANQSTQVVADNSIISLGAVQRRFGCNIRLDGNAIVCGGEGYYTIDAGVSVTPTGAGPVTVALYDNGVQVPGAIASTTGTANAPIAVNLPPCTIRQRCCSDADNLTLVLVEGAGDVTNVAVRVEKV